LLYEDWRGYLPGLFALVWVATQYMSVYNRLRLDTKHQRMEIKAVEKEVEKSKLHNVASAVFFSADSAF
jgi:hypothetical protein